MEPQQRSPASRQARRGLKVLYGQALTWAAVLLLAGLQALADAGKPAAALDVSVAMEVRAAIGRACNFLLTAQRPDGSWDGDAETTSLALQALANAADADAADYQTAITAAAGFCHTTASSADVGAGSLARALQGLIRRRLETDAGIILAGRRRLLSMQFPDNAGAAAGGFAVKAGVPPDLRTSQLVLETLYLSDHLERRAEVGEAAASLDRAYAAGLGFIRRCQIRDGSEAGAFRRHPDAATPLTPELDSLGLTALLYAALPLEDAGVATGLARLAAADFLRTPQAAPRLCRAHARLWRALERRQAEAVPAAWRGWRHGFALKLLAAQQGDGSWQEPDLPAAADQAPATATALATLALQLL